MSTNPGDKPTIYPKRYKAYYRALKRGEPWAIRFSKMSPATRILAWMYRDIDVKMIFSKNPILGLVEKDMSGCYFPIPIAYDPKDKDGE